MAETKNSTQKMPDHEVLARMVNDLKAENSKLREALRQSNYTNVYRRLDYLFKVIEQRDAYLTSIYPEHKEFYYDCLDETVQVIAIRNGSDNDIDKKPAEEKKDGETKEG